MCFLIVFINTCYLCTFQQDFFFILCLKIYARLYVHGVSQDLPKKKFFFFFFFSIFLHFSKIIPISD